MKKSCPYCISDKIVFVTDEIRDSKNSIIRKCESCGLIFLDSHEKFATDLNKFYNEDYSVEYSLIAGKKISVSDHFNIKLKTQRQLIPYITPYLKPSFDILEVGCGPGALLYLLKNLVNSCTGVEINREQVEYAKVKLGSKIYTTSITEIPEEQKFDVVFLISVLEHMKNPFKTLVDLRNLLNRGGTLFIEIPNCNEALMNFLPENNARKYRKFFYHKAHLYYFTEDFFGKLLKNCGYQFEVSSRHDYTLINFLHWWFLGERQISMETAQRDIGLYNNEDDPFKKDMNDIFSIADAAFKKIMRKHKHGYILTYVAKLAE